MADPISMAITAFGQYQQGKAAKAEAKTEAAWHKYNADVNMQEARVREERAAVESSDARKQSQRALASQRTALSAAGIALSGSPLQVMEESAANMERSILDISRQGATEAQALRSQAGINLFQAQTAKLKGKNLQRAYYTQAGASTVKAVGDTVKFAKGL
jgi:hypothetical protein